MKRKPTTYALAQIDVVPGRPDINAERIVRESRLAAERGVDVIIFPEMCVSGYLLGDLFEDDAFIHDVEHWNEWIAAELSGLPIVVIFGTIIADWNKVGEDGRVRKYNAAVVVHRGVFLTSEAGLPFHPKALHPNYRIFDDSRHFFCARKLAAEMGVPVDDLVRPFAITIRGRSEHIGLIVCEDMWGIDYSVKPCRIHKQNGATIIVNVSCSPWSWRKNQKRDSVVSDIIADIGLPFIYVNNVGSQNNGKNIVTFDGSSTVYNERGDIVCLVEMYVDTVVDYSFSDDLQIRMCREVSDTAQLFFAVLEGWRGYTRTVPIEYRKKVVIGASGGIDSSLSVAFFAHAYGAENVIAVNMPYKHFNAKETRDDAMTLCRNLGVEYRVMPIDSLVDANAALCGISEGTPQFKSIMARMRMEVLASAASQVSGIFICNANKTEIAFGYGTLNGDLRGYFAPWMDCLKQEVYRLSDYLNRVVYRREVIPQSIIDRDPMDELTATGSRRDPFFYGSVTENGYHDQLVRAFVTFRRNPEWVLFHYQAGTLDRELMLPQGTVARHFGTPREFIDDLERCRRLFTSMVFKRIQSVPGVLLDKRSFGFDYRESMLLLVSTRRFCALKDALLADAKEEVVV